MTNFVGTVGNDSLTGTKSYDNFYIANGGDDTVAGFANSDDVWAGAALSMGDVIDGGEGFDTLHLNGDYAAGVSVDGANIQSIEYIFLAAGHDYRLILTGDWQVSQRLYADALGAADSLDIDGSAMTGGSLLVRTGAGADRLVGGAGSDAFELTGGGDDTAFGGAGDDGIGCELAGEVRLDGGEGDDQISLGATLSAGDRISGGTGLDEVRLFDTFAEKQVLTPQLISGVERVSLEGYESFHLVLTDDIATPGLEGGWFEVDGSYLSGGSVAVDGRLEDDTSLRLVGGYGADRLLGGRMDDTLVINRYSEISGDDDTVFGGAGADTIVGSTLSLTGADRIDGGAGRDTLIINGFPNMTPIDLRGMTGVETILVFKAAHIVLADANVGAGEVLSIDAELTDVSDPSVPTGVMLDGAAELDGRLNVLGGAGDNSLVGGGARDTLLGGAGDDTILGGNGPDKLIGGAGADRLVGGGGVDWFVYQATTDSVGAQLDWDRIAGLNNFDVIDLRAIDAKTGVDGDQAFKLVDGFTGKGGQAVLSYDNAARLTFLELDVDGDALTDATIVLEGKHLDFTNFLL